VVILRHYLGTHVLPEKMVFRFQIVTGDRVNRDLAITPIRSITMLRMDPCKIRKRTFKVEASDEFGRRNYKRQAQAKLNGNKPKLVHLERMHGSS
jgi:hypothetical protein